MDYQAFFDALWQDFTHIAPAAASIHRKLTEAGEVVLNDHVAFRTFDRGPLRLETLEPHLLALGYERFAPYAFEGKKLSAWGYLHPDPKAPRVFLSELRVSEFSERFQAIVDELVAQIPADAHHTPGVFWSGRPWAPVDFATWEALRAESEYGAWMAALGYHANHFTVSINALSESMRSVEAVLQFVESHGFQVNTAGGRVKGSPEVLLEQGSTLADLIELPFADGLHAIPTCYYEFALRHNDAQGNLYNGFVAASADKIFESTDVANR